ncbi:uncharacterized protein FSUBG_6133 [Fusarium subglutinans]|uniref:Uncharacterized protein n=1 Tax=Gibberella subglutinans TaxID=42677 RepID=A0A8H5Q016_GIBSU|nr:uncharacterized protein FSUBG_6133 [Fusarium subglutinans]KAF5606300.1 hypothetical protein FSUBG_6133 [Fusarium subglutinans]
MAPKGWINTNLKPGKGRATRAGIRDTKEDIYRFPDPGSDSEFAPDPQPPSDAEEESDNAGPTTTQTGSFRDYPCVPCLKHMLKVPSNGHPEPCTDRTGGNYVACKFCGDKNLGCESPARYAKKHLIEWDKDDRREFIERFIKVAAKLQDAVTDNKKGLQQSNWKKVVKEVQTEVNKVETAKAKQEAHEAKKKYEALREETDQIWARLKEVEDWIEKKTELFLSKDEDDNMFVRFMASAIILEKKDRKKFQETLDYIRGVGNDGTTDDDAAGEEEEEQQESSEEAREDEDVHMVSG